MRKLSLVLTVLAMSILLCSCSGTKVVSKKGLYSYGEISGISGDVNSLGMELLQNCKEIENPLVSPLGAYLSVNTLNGTVSESLENYVGKFENDNFADAKLAESLWFSNDCNIDKTFINSVRKLNCTIYKTDFDKKTQSYVASWAKSVTNNNVTKYFESEDEIKGSKFAVINSFVFEAKWASQIANETESAIFTDKNGEEQKVNYLCSYEDKIIKTAKCDGFVKSYDGGGYVFFAMMPKNNKSVDLLVDSITTSEIKRYITETKNYTAKVKMPQFTVFKINDLYSAYSKTDKLSEIKNLSGILAFETVNVDIFSQKNYFHYGARGSKSGEATAAPEEEHTDENLSVIKFDRPFLYGVYDTKTETILLIGVMSHIE